MASVKRLHPIRVIAVIFDFCRIVPPSDFLQLATASWTLTIPLKHHLCHTVRGLSDSVANPLKLSTFNLCYYGFLVGYVSEDNVVVVIWETYWIPVVSVWWYWIPNRFAFLERIYFTNVLNFSVLIAVALKPISFHWVCCLQMFLHRHLLPLYCRDSRSYLRTRYDIVVRC